MNELNFSCTPEEAKDDSYLENRIWQELGISPKQKLTYRWRKRSIDARGRKIKINLNVLVGIDEILINDEILVSDVFAPKEDVNFT